MNEGSQFHQIGGQTSLQSIEPLLLTFIQTGGASKVFAASDTGTSLTLNTGQTSIIF